MFQRKAPKGMFIVTSPMCANTQLSFPSEYAVIVTAFLMGLHGLSVRTVTMENHPKNFLCIDRRGDRLGKRVIVERSHPM